MGQGCICFTNYVAVTLVLSFLLHAFKAYLSSLLVVSLVEQGLTVKTMDRTDAIRSIRTQAQTARLAQLSFALYSLTAVCIPYTPTAPCHVLCPSNGNLLKWQAAHLKQAAPPHLQLEITHRKGRYSTAASLHGLRVQESHTGR